MLKPSIVYRLLLLCIVVPTTSFADGGIADGWADVMRIETARGGLPPLLSELIPDLDLPYAYAVQRAVVRDTLGGRLPGGYKAGFTSAAARAKFGLDGPAYGVLYAQGARRDGAVIKLADFHHLLIELEIGFELRSAIHRPMKSIADLKTYVRHAMPVIDLADLRFARLEGLNALDIIATNIGSAAWLVGTPFALADLEQVNSISATLTLDDEVIDSGQASTAMGNQLEALLWLINQVQAAGWPLAAGQVLITGTLGRINPPVPGHYRADYGPHSPLSFEVVGADAQTQSP